MATEATHTKKSDVRARDEAAAGVQQMPAAARALQQGQVQSIADGAAEAVATRAEQIDALPEFGKVTGLVAVEAGKTIYLTPLRSGTLAAAYFDEATNVTTVMGKTQEVIKVVSATIADKMQGFDLRALQEHALRDLQGTRAGGVRRGGDECAGGDSCRD
jgi:hypothetical protein